MLLWDVRAPLPIYTMQISMNDVGARRMTSNAISSCNHMVRVTTMFPTNAHAYRYGNGHPGQTCTGVQDKWIQASETHGYGLPE